MSRTVLVILGIATVTLVVVSRVQGNLAWIRGPGAAWEFADRASTLEEKHRLISEFVQKLEAAGLEGEHSQTFFQTPENSFDYNMKALRSLRDRLAVSKGMAVTSVEYQMAMQQVTAQEQGEAANMIGSLRECWIRDQYMSMELAILLSFVSLVVGFVLPTWLTINPPRSRRHYGTRW